MGEDTPREPQPRDPKIVAEPQAAAFLHAHGYNEPLELNTQGMPCPSVDHGNLDVHNFVFGEPLRLEGLPPTMAERARDHGIGAFMQCGTCGWVEPVFEATDEQMPPVLRELVEKLRTNLAEEDDDA